MGVITYGTPPSSGLKTGLAGPDYAPQVIELNRLVLTNNRPNEASFFISRTLKQLPQPKIVVSFADISAGHNVYVYQASNFIYTGLSAKRNDYKIRGMEHLHGYSINDEFRGRKNRSEAIREKYGDNFYIQQRPRKHRYIYILGNRHYKNDVLHALRYGIQEYPKGDNRPVMTGPPAPETENLDNQIVLF